MGPFNTPDRPPRTGAKLLLYYPESISLGSGFFMGKWMNIKRIIFNAVLTVLILLVGSQEISAKTLFDQLGRRVTLPDNPERIVSLAPSITEIIFALGQEHRLKGVTQFSDFPVRAKSLPSVGSYVHLDIEKIVSLKPDLCIAVKDGNPKSVINKLESLNIPVYAVDPRDLESVMGSLNEIGGLLGSEKKAASLVKDMRARIDKVTSTVKKSNHIPGVFFQIGISPIVAIGTDTLIHELIVLAGGNNLTKGKIPYPRFSKEQVIALSPEIFIITSMARGEVFNQVKADWQRWADMPAVKNDRIVLVDSNIFDRATPRLLDGLELMARLIHPELFETKTNRGKY